MPSGWLERLTLGEAGSTFAPLGGGLLGLGFPFFPLLPLFPLFKGGAGVAVGGAVCSVGVAVGVNWVAPTCVGDVGRGLLPPDDDATVAVAAIAPPPPVLGKPKKEPLLFRLAR